MTPRLVLFDMDDVLCRHDQPGHVAEIARLARLSQAQVRARIWTSGFDSDADKGLYDAESFLKELAERLGVIVTADDWVATRRRITHPWPDALALAAQAGSGARIAVLTNNNKLLGERIGDIFPELPRVFGKAIFTSAQLCAVKPDAACYHACCAQLGIDPPDTLFIDDRAENVAGARQAGLRSHQFTSVENMRDLFRGAGLL